VKDKEKVAARKVRKVERDMWRWSSGMQGRLLERTVEKSFKALRKPPKVGKTYSKTPLLIGYKKDASFVGLLVLRLQQETIPLLKDSKSSSLVVDEYIFNDSILIIDSHFTQFKDFPKKWLDLQGFLEKVHLLPSLGQLFYLPILLSLTCCCCAAQNGPFPSF
jgi:hypothetical protein